MELFGTVLAVPVAFALSAVYIAIANRVVKGFPRLSTPLTRVSALVLAMFVAEILLLIGIGPVRSRDLFGSAFDLLHLVVFFFGVPALANLMISRSGQEFHGCLPTLACMVFALVLVALQYAVP